MDSAISNYDEAIKNAKLVEAANSDTEELLQHISHSVLFFTYSEGDEGIARFDLALSKKGLNDLVSDIKKLRTEWYEANNLFGVARDHELTAQEKAAIIEAYDRAKTDAERAAIQSVTLESMSRENRTRTLKVAEDYRRFLEDQDRRCRRAIISLVVVGSALALLSQIAGIKEGAVMSG